MFNMFFCFSNDVSQTSMPIKPIRIVYTKYVCMCACVHIGANADADRPIMADNISKLLYKSGSDIIPAESNTCVMEEG